jgi:hypothetical protein
MLDAARRFRYPRRLPRSTFGLQHIASYFEGASIMGIAHVARTYRLLHLTTTCRSRRLLSIGYTEPLRCYHLPSTWHRVTFLASFKARHIRPSVDDTTTYLEDSNMMTFLTARCWI